MKHLSRLLQDIPELKIELLQNDPEISAISGTIQDCVENALFVADVSETVDRERMGERMDGVDFIPQAIEAGARVILTRHDAVLPEKYKGTVLFLQEEKPMRFLGPLAASFYNHKKPDFVGAITGTNGKTSIVNFAAQLFGLAGKAAVSVGNMGIRNDSCQVIDMFEAGIAVPETVDLHRLLYKFNRQGKRAFFTEATSHSIHYYRLEGMTCNAAAISNITHDHLDFHGTMENYFQTKARLFTEILSEDGTAILNADMDYFDELKAMCKKAGRKIIEYGRNAKDLRLLSSNHINNQLLIRFSWNGKTYAEAVPFVGYFQAYNILCSLAFAFAAELEPDQLIPLISKLCPVEGRMEFVGNTLNGNFVYIDYAHTPDALLQVLKTARDIKQKRIISVFSCNGDRDKDKRPKMGEISQNYADLSIVTDGLPRSETPLEIRNGIISTSSELETVLSIEGRATAIKQAIKEAQEDDIIVIAGMGIRSWPDKTNGNKIVTDANIALNSGTQ